MLVLSRQENEQVYIYQEGDDRPLAIVTVCRIQGVNGHWETGQVRLGFEGDPDIVFHRREIAESIIANGEDPSLPLFKGHKKA